MRGAVERQATLITCCKVCMIGQNGPQKLRAAAPLERGLEVDLKVNQQRLGRGQKELATRRILDGSAAKRQHQPVAAGELRVAEESCNGRPLSRAELRFAFALEDLGNRRTRPALRSIRSAARRNGSRSVGSRLDVPRISVFFRQFHSFQYKDDKDRGQVSGVRFQ